jgi:hypothetical protein
MAGSCDHSCQYISSLSSLSILYVLYLSTRQLPPLLWALRVPPGLRPPPGAPPSVATRAASRAPMRGLARSSAEIV